MGCRLEGSGSASPPDAAPLLGAGGQYGSPVRRRRKKPTSAVWPYLGPPLGPGPQLLLAPDSGADFPAGPAPGGGASSGLGRPHRRRVRFSRCTPSPSRGNRPLKQGGLEQERKGGRTERLAKLGVVSKARSSAQNATAERGSSPRTPAPTAGGAAELSPSRTPPAGARPAHAAVVPPPPPPGPRAPESRAKTRAGAGAGARRCFLRTQALRGGQGGGSALGFVPSPPGPRASPPVSSLGPSRPVRGLAAGSPEAFGSFDLEPGKGLNSFRVVGRGHGFRT